MSNRNLIRQGDTMIAVETRSAVVPFDEILAACKVVENTDDYDSPWDRCDGFEHEARPPHKLPDAADARAMQGYCRTWDRGERFVIDVPRENKATFDYYRQNGASRQVAAEMVALDRRRTLATIVKWYEDGWVWYGVRCQVDALGEEFADSLWGIDVADYAEKEIKIDVACEVAGQLEAAGYTVTGKPNRAPTREDKIAGRRWRALLQCWAA